MILAMGCHVLGNQFVPTNHGLITPLPLVTLALSKPGSERKKNMFLKFNL